METLEERKYSATANEFSCYWFQKLMQPDSETSLNTVLSNGAKGESAVARKKEKRKKIFFYLVGVWKENTGLTVTNNNDDDSGVLKSLFSQRNPWRVHYILKLKRRRRKIMITRSQ